MLANVSNAVLLNEHFITQPSKYLKREPKASLLGRVDVDVPLSRDNRAWLPLRGVERVCVAHVLGVAKQAIVGTAAPSALAIACMVLLKRHRSFQ